DTATFGITWYAQDTLGEVVFFEPPEPGTTVSKDSSYAEVESVKAVSDVIAPMSGEVTEVNDALADSPEQINEDPYGAGWMIKVGRAHGEGGERLLPAAEYKKVRDRGGGRAARRKAAIWRGGDGSRPPTEFPSL